MKPPLFKAVFLLIITLTGIHRSFSQKSVVIELSDKDSIYKKPVSVDEAADFLNYVNNSFGSKKKELIRRNLQLMHMDPFAVKEDFWNKLNGFRSLNVTNFIPGFNDKGFVSGRLGNLEVDILYNNPTISASPLTRVSFNNSISLMGIPFQVDLMNLNDGFNQFRQSSLGRFSFDKNHYQQLLRSRLEEAYSLKKILDHEYEVLDYLKSHYADNIKQQLKDIVVEGVSDSKQFIDSKLNKDELVALNDEQIYEKLLSASDKKNIIDQIHADTKILTGSEYNLSEKDAEVLKSKIKTNQAYLKYVDQVHKVIVENRGKVANAGLNPQKIYQLQNKLKTEGQQLLRDPKEIARIAKDLLPLNGIQKFFANVDKLNAGTFSEETLDKGVSNLLTNAGSLAMNKKKNIYTFGAGQFKDVGYLQNMGQVSSQFMPTGNMQFFNISKNKEDIRNATSITFSNINVKTLSHQNLQDAAFSRNLFVGSVSKNVAVREEGIITAEFSKSSSQFHNQVNEFGEAVEQKAAIQTIGSDFFQTISAGVRYMDHWKEWGLTNNAYVAYSGQGYNNPGNGMSGRGALQMDIQLKKDISRRKGYIHFRYATRGYNTDMEKGADFRNTAYALGMKYNLNKRMRLGARLDLSQMFKIKESASKAYQNLKLTGDANFTTQVSGLKLRHIAVLSVQNYSSHQLAEPVKSNLLLLNYNTILPLKINSLLFNFSWNKELADTYFVNNMINTEVSYQYTIKNIISLNSGITYLNSVGFARQIGIRQGVGFNAGKRISVNGFADVRKNLITPVASYLYSNFRGNLSLIYMFNKN